MQRSAIRVLVVPILLFAAGCSSHSGTLSTTTLAPRPASTAKLALVTPANGATEQGPVLHVQADLQGATLVKQASTNLVPNEGHLHLYLDGKLVSMTQGTSQDIPGVTPGHHVVRVAFVANDHAPFNPPVFAQAAVQVQG